MDTATLRQTAAAARRRSLARMPIDTLVGFANRSGFAPRRMTARDSVASLVAIIMHDEVYRARLDQHVEAIAQYRAALG